MFLSFLLLCSLEQCTISFNINSGKISHTYALWCLKVLSLWCFVPWFENNSRVVADARAPLMTFLRQCWNWRMFVYLAAIQSILLLCRAHTGHAAVHSGPWSPFPPCAQRGRMFRLQLCQGVMSTQRYARGTDRFSRTASFTIRNINPFGKE